MAAGTPVSAEEFADLFKQVSNWGRWGADDQRGALNLIGPEQVLAASRLVREGVTVNCSLPLNKDADVDNSSPALHFMVRSGDAPGATSMADFLGLAPHGVSHTHLDAMCHFFWEGQMYNGRPISQVTSMGALAGAVDVAQNGIVSRGVLLDVSGARGAKWLEPGDCVGIAELEAAEAAEGVRVRQGDILLVRTGRHRRRRQVGPWSSREALAGLHASTAPWIQQRGVALLGCDGVTDYRPLPTDYTQHPMHILTLVAMGIMLLDNCQLDDLAEACNQRRRWEFMLVVAPLRLERGTASAVNPIAIF